MSNYAAMDEANARRIEAERAYEQAFADQIAKARKDKTMREWLGFPFRSSSGLTPEFAAFFPQYVATIRRLLGPGYKLTMKRGHQDAYGYAQNKANGQWVFLSCSQVCYFQDDWYAHILIRRVENNQNSTSGHYPNNFCTLPEIKTAADTLTGGERIFL